MWHLTPDTWHLTLDMWHLEGVNILSEFQLPSSYGLGVMMFEGLEEKDESMN